MSPMRFRVDWDNMHLTCSDVQHGHGTAGGTGSELKTPPLMGLMGLLSVINGLRTPLIGIFASLMGLFKIDCNRSSLLPHHRFCCISPAYFPMGDAGSRFSPPWCRAAGAPNPDKSTLCRNFRFVGP